MPKLKLLMAFFLTLILLTSCNTFPPDDSPSWAENNRFAVEMSTNCNTTYNSVGMAGCAFKGKVDADAYLRFPSFWPSDINLVSARCGNKSYKLGKNRFLKLSLLKLALDDKSCSYTVTRKVRDVGRKNPDRKMIGRFFLKIISNNKFYKLMTFEMGKNIFKGVGWYQRPSTTIAPPLIIYPKGKEGVVLVQCGDETVEKLEFYETPVILELGEGRSCDYEISVINDDSPIIEFATFIYEESNYTEDIPKPKTYIKLRRRYFDFKDFRTGTGAKAIVGIKVNNTYCKGSDCKVKTGRDKYEVRAVTSSLRYFYGIFDAKSKTWEIK